MDASHATAWESVNLLFPAESAVKVGGAILSQGRSHVGALIPKGDRDFGGRPAC